MLLKLFMESILRTCATVRNKWAEAKSMVALPQLSQYTFGVIFHGRQVCAMRPKCFILPVLLLLTLSGMALAEEIIYFTNGTSMPIRRHEIKGDMIHVDLGSEAAMAFPFRMIEKIEEAGKSVSLRPSSGGNTVLSARVPTPEGNYPVRGSYSGQALRNKPEVEFISNSELEAVKSGSTRKSPQMHYPGAGQGAANKARVATVGGANPLREAAATGINYPGTNAGVRPKGTRNVIGDPAAARRGNGGPERPQPISKLTAPAKPKSGGSGN
jgi:hypothetical protein